MFFLGSEITSVALAERENQRETTCCFDLVVFVFVLRVLFFVLCFFLGGASLYLDTFQTALACKLSSLRLWWIGESNFV